MSEGAEDRVIRVTTYESSCTEVPNEAMILRRTRMLNKSDSVDEMRRTPMPKYSRGLLACIAVEIVGVVWVQRDGQPRRPSAATTTSTRRLYAVSTAPGDSDRSGSLSSVLLSQRPASPPPARSCLTYPRPTINLRNPAVQPLSPYDMTSSSRSQNQSQSTSASHPQQQHRRGTRTRPLEYHDHSESPSLLARGEHLLAQTTKFQVGLIFIFIEQQFTEHPPGTNA